jgi:lysophospholipase L1-like esterase
MKAFVLFLCFSSLSVAAQQSTPVNTAAQNLEKWRQSRVSVYMNDFGELGRYRQANAALPAPAAAEQRVVFFGDSITDGWDLTKYFPGKPYVNRGIGGQTTSQMLVRFRQDVIDLKPKVVVILAGTNDIAGNTGPIAIADIEANMASMAELARLHNIRVIISSVTPVHDYTLRAQEFFALRPPAAILELNGWLKRYCAENDLLYLDYFGAMVDKQGSMKRELADDGLHPNAEGYAVMVPLVSAAIEKELAAK